MSAPGDGDLHAVSSSARGVSPVQSGTEATVHNRSELARERWREALGPRERSPCPHCEEAFARPGYRVLHLGRRHDARLSEEQKAHFEAVEQAERAVMREIALHTKSALFALPLFIVWALTLVLLIELQTNIAWMLMATPGYALFAALIYVMAYGYQSGGRESYHGRS